MIKLSTTLAAATLLGLAACNQGPSPAEQAAENVEQATEQRAERIDEMADNAMTDAGEDMLNQRADNVREMGDAHAEALREGEIPVDAVTK